MTKMSSIQLYGLLICNHSSLLLRCSQPGCTSTRQGSAVKTSKHVAALPLQSLCSYPTVASKASSGLLHAMLIATSTPRAQQRAAPIKGKRLPRRHGQRTLECGTDPQMAKLKMLFKLAMQSTTNCRVTSFLVFRHGSAATPQCFLPSTKPYFLTAQQQFLAAESAYILSLASSSKPK
jgi:hypothetical protein